MRVCVHICGPKKSPLCVLSGVGGGVAARELGYVPLSLSLFSLPFSQASFASRERRQVPLFWEREREIWRHSHFSTPCWALLGPLYINEDSFENKDAIVCPVPSYVCVIVEKGGWVLIRVASRTKFVLVLEKKIFK